MAKKTKGTKVRKPKAPRENTSYVIRKLCLENQLATVGEIETLAKEQGHKIDGNTLRGVYQGAMGLIKQATKLGFTIEREPATA